MYVNYWHQPNPLTPSHRPNNFLSALFRLRLWRPAASRTGLRAKGLHSIRDQVRETDDAAERWTKRYLDSEIQTVSKYKKEPKLEFETSIWDGVDRHQHVSDMIVSGKLVTKCRLRDCSLGAAYFAIINEYRMGKGHCRHDPTAFRGEGHILPCSDNRGRFQTINRGYGGAPPYLVTTPKKIFSILIPTTAEDSKPCSSFDYSTPESPLVL